MNIHGTPTRTLRLPPGHCGVDIIDPTLLPTRALRSRNGALGIYYH